MSSGRVRGNEVSQRYCNYPSTDTNAHAEPLLVTLQRVSFLPQANAIDFLFEHGDTVMHIIMPSVVISQASGSNQCLQEMHFKMCWHSRVKFLQRLVIQLAEILGLWSKGKAFKVVVLFVCVCIHS